MAVERTPRLLFVILCASILLTACENDDGESQPGPYADEAMWLCKPGAASNSCLELDQTTTHVLSNGSFEVIEHSNAANPAFDCFYVYPTVNESEEPGNTEDLSDVVPMLLPLHNQAARFGQLCDLYVPLYHQMTIGSYSVQGDVGDSAFFAIAYNDVEDAFLQYLRESGDRPFVLMGHSQGSHMLIRLLGDYFDNDPQLRKRLISALLIGPVGRLEVPEGKQAGGSFENIPLCQSADETACIIAYDSIAEGGIADREPGSRPCVNPTLLDGEAGVLAAAFWESSNGMPFPAEIETAWVAYPAMHTANCEADGFLAIGTVEEERQPPLTPAVVQLVLEADTLHVPDVNYALGDLLRIVEKQAAAIN